MPTLSLAELLDSSMVDVVMHFVAFGPPFIFLFVLYFIIILFMLLMISFGWFWHLNDYRNVCVLALLTGSPDFSILATDVETGSTIARLDNAHE
jgi:hypothetical protein